MINEMEWNTYHPFLDSHLKFEIMEMSPMYLAVAQTVHDPYQRQTMTKISQHVQPVNH